ncbi:MAG TPA: hypothetical protein VKF39_01335 [Nitrososphaerales archaeon]|nr:hypothetical protein [Nitrososphaerales archaeon]
MMKTENDQNHNFNHSKGTRTLLLGLALLIVGSAFATGTAFGSTTSFNNVQVFVTTSAPLPYSYTFSAYNLTGSLVAFYQGSYPAAAFELPTGDYLFTVSAVHQTYCYACVTPLNGGSTPPPTTGSASATPVQFYQPTAEYGWLQAHVDSSTSLSIQSKNVTTFPTTSVSVKVSFVNGTAAAGAWVSASVVGQWYYWWGQDSGIVMSAQTDNNGMATLVIPVAPAVITAWDWVPVNLPKNATTAVVNVGGQNVNVTVYWQPTYVGLSASTLLIPPANSADLTLKYQQPTYWYLPMGVGYAQAQSGQGGATIANQPSGVPTQVNQQRTASTQTGQAQMFLPTQIPAIQAQGASSSPTSAKSGGLVMAWEVAALAVGAFAALGVTLVVLGRKQRPSGASA